MSSDRLYVVVRADLPIGLQMAQACHAAYGFARVYGNMIPVGENLVVLHATNEAELDRLCEQSTVVVDNRVERHLPIFAFYEPDLDGQLTAAAFNAEARKFLRNLPLAFSASRGSSGATCRSSGSDTSPAGAQT